MPGWVADILFKLGEHVLPSIVRLIYKENRFREQIKIRARGEGDCVQWQLGELPSVRFWLHVTNSTPFEIQIDRLYGWVVYGSYIAQFIQLKRYIFSSSEDKEIYIETSLTSTQVEMIKKQHQPRPDTRLEVNAYVMSAVWDTELIGRTLHPGGVRFSPPLQ